MQDKSDSKERDKHITRRIHRLFWHGNTRDLAGLIIMCFTRFPAMFIFNVLIPFLTAYGLQAIIERQFDQVGTYAWYIFAAACVYGLLWAIGGIVICRNGRIGVQFVQKEIFRNYLQKDYEFYNNNFLGALGAQAIRLRDAYNEYNQLFMIQIPKQLIIVTTSILIIALQSALLAGVTLVAMALVLSYTILSSRWRLKFRRRLSTAGSELAGQITDALSHGASVKSFAAEKYEERRLSTKLTSWATIQYHAWLSSIPADTGRMLLAGGATAVLLVMTAGMYKSGAITIAIVILVQLYVVKLVAATLDIAEIVKSYETVMGGAYQSVKTMLVRPTVIDKQSVRHLTKKSKPQIALQNVTFTYGDDATNPALQNITLTVQPGEKVGLVGYSGSGKTTLTKLLLRFMDVTGGNIKFGGLDIRDMSQQELRQHISYVPQEPVLFHRSIAENIAYGKPSAPHAKVQAAAKTAYVDEFVKDLPNGLDTMVGERGVKLSGGQRQRVAIARALLKDAPVLVLDEATSALDSRSEQLIQKALWRLMKDRTTLVIAHRLSTIQRMDRIVVIDRGKIVQIGTHEELLKNKKGIYAELWAHQSGGYVGVPAQVDTTPQEASARPGEIVASVPA